MNRNTYRICLMVLIMAAVASGIFYYRLSRKKTLLPKEGTLVWQCGKTGACI